MIHIYLVTFCLLILKLHWNNPELHAHYRDSSGMILHYTPHLRPNDAGMLVAGQLHLDIPPGTDSYTVHGTCSHLCSQDSLQQPVKIVSTLLHMHYMGKFTTASHEMKP